MSKCPESDGKKNVELTDDCIIKTMSYLNWMDSVNFAIAYPRYEAAARWRLRTVDYEWRDGRISWIDSHKIATSAAHTSKIVDRTGSHIRIELKWNDKHNYNDAEPFFNFIGRYISFLSLIGICGNDVNTIASLCHNVESLKLNYCRINRDALCGLDLKELTLNNCFFDEVCWTGLTTLKRLEIVAPGLDLQQLDELLVNNESLEHLTINGLVEFDKSAFNKLKKSTI